MVYHNAVAQVVSNPAYENETFRAKAGYKETHQHDPAYRRNRDFKPVPYGSFRGMPNYKHSEPYCLLKNMKDLSNEDHHHPIKWIKLGLKGALTGSIFGYLWFVVVFRMLCCPCCVVDASVFRGCGVSRGFD